MAGALPDSLARAAVVMGSEELASGVGRRVRWIHDFVTGPTYRASDPDNLLWVQATLTDSALRAYTTLVHPLTADEEETYYQEMCRAAEPFGLSRPHQPATLADFRAYFEDTVAGLRVTDTGRQLAAYIVAPALPARLHVPLAPALALHRLFAIGSLPQDLRHQFGFAWDERSQRRYQRAEGAIRRLFRVAPRPLRVGPGWLGGRIVLSLARRRVRRFEAKRATAAD